MLSLKLLATAAAVMSSIVVAAPTGSPNTVVTDPSAPTETNGDCYNEFLKCLNKSPVLPVTLAWYADCAHKERECNENNPKDIQARGDITVNCDALLQECLKFYSSPHTLAGQRNCEFTYQACQLANPPKAKREVSDTEEPVIDNSSVLTKRSECTDECNKNYDVCLYSLGPNPPATWPQYCAELLAKCNWNCPDKRAISESEDVVTDESSDLFKRSECTDECNKNYNICLYSLGPNPPATWPQYCAELLAKCNWNCPDKRSAPSTHKDVSAPLTQAGVQDCYDDCAKTRDECLAALGPNPPVAGKIECKSKEILCRPKCPCFDVCDRNFSSCIVKPNDQAGVQTTTCTASLIICYGVCGTDRLGASIEDAPSSDLHTVAERSIVKDDNMAPEALATLTKRTECTDECYDNYLALLGSLGPNPPQYWHIYCAEILAKCNGSCPPE